MKLEKSIEKFNTWRIKNISDQNFILILSVLIGFLAGMAAIIIKNSVFFIRALLESAVNIKYGNYLYIIYPVIGILLSLLFIKFILRRQRIDHGIPIVLKAISKNNSIIPFHNTYSAIITSVLTVGFGGSVGLEGPSVSTGAAIGSNLGRKLKLNYKYNTLLIGCASAAAIASIFKAPIAGVVFSLEIIMLDLTMSSLVPLLISSVTSILTSYLLLGQNVIYHFKTNPTFNIENVLFYVLLGVLCGLASIYFTKLYAFINRVFDKIKNDYNRLLIGGSLLGFCILMLPSLYGEGYNEINSCLRGDLSFVFKNSMFGDFNNSTVAAFFLLFAIVLVKVMATSFTFGAGGIGGIFAPALFIGACLGLLFASVNNYYNIKTLPLDNFSLVGMAGVFAGVMHAPLTAIFLIADITKGYNLIVPLIITSTISYLTIKLFVPYSINTVQLAEKGELITHDKDKAVLTLMKIDKLIEKNFCTVFPDSTLGDFVKIVATSSRNIFPVTDAENNFLGVVVITDIRHIIFNQELYNSVLVSELMTLPSPLVDPDESMEQIATKFEHSEHYNLPVVKNGKYIGFVSRANVFSEYRKLLKSFSEA
jgi:CIC family chloride channel protein